MNSELQAAFLNSVTTVGFDTALSILKAMNSKPTIDDVIKALEDAQKITWAQAKVGQV